MSIVCELASVISTFEESSELYLAQEKEQLTERVFSVSPRDDGKLCYSRSLDRYSSLLEEGTPDEGDSTQAVVKQQVASTSSEGMTVKFSVPDKLFVDILLQSRFQFEKVAVPAEIPVVASKLSECIVPVKMLSLRVFLPKRSSYDPPVVNVRIQETEKVEALILTAIRAYNSATKLAQLSTDSLKPYQLCTAEDDGSPEEFGTLRLDQSAARLGDTFGLVIKETGRPAAVDRPPLVVRLPNNTKTMVPFQPGLKVGDLIRKICDKRGMNTADFHISTVGNDQGHLRGSLASDLLLEGLPNCEFQLCANANEFESPALASSILTEHDALKYKVFDVTYGKKKNYALGISDEHIRILKKKGHQTVASKQSVRNTSDVLSVEAGDKSKQFTINWKDGKQDIFESSSRDEIIEKLNYILGR